VRPRPALRLPPSYARAALLALVAWGAWLRFSHLDHGFWLDEVTTWWHANLPFSHLWFTPYRMPHIFALTRFFLLLGGGSEAWIRLPYALYGVLCIPAAYALGRRLFGAEEGLAAAFLTASSSYLIHYSQEARYYPLLVFYSTCVLYCLVSAVGARHRRERRLYWALFTLCHLLNLCLQNLAVYPAALSALFLFGYAAALWWTGRREKLKEILVYGGASLVLMAAALLYLAEAKLLFHPLWWEFRDAPRLIETYWTFPRPEGNVFFHFFELLSGGRYPAYVFLGLCALALASGWRRRKGDGGSQGQAIRNLHIGDPRQRGLLHVPNPVAG